jgi:flavin-binding protein dodecin
MEPKSPSPGWRTGLLPGRQQAIAGDRNHTSCGGHVMSIAKVIEISSQSPKGIEEAIRDGLKRASKTINNIKGAWINDIKVVTDDSGKVTDWRVNMRINFVLD